VTVRVAVDPLTAFDVFTTEIDQWYRKGAAVLAEATRGSTLRFEPGVGGRLLEVRDDGRPPVMRGHITVWEPGARLLFVDRREAEVEVWFQAFDAGTRVVLEHRGLDKLPPDAAIKASKYSWRKLVDFFATYMEDPRW
jgi:Activator of Hsp90 ATPase homolog 1-like protein